MRLIDADNLKSVLQNIREHLEESGTQQSMIGSSWIEYAIEVVGAQYTVSPSSNDPLTLEELREMEGEPVWFSNDFTKTHTWRVISHVSKWIVYFTDGGSGIIKDYGKTWMAYRRKPEEGTT